MLQVEFKPVVPLIIFAFALAGACTGACGGGKVVVDGTGPGEAAGQLADPAAEAAEGSGIAEEDGSGDEQAAQEEEPEFVCEWGTPDGEGGCILRPEDRRGALGREGLWAHVLDECPDPELGAPLEIWEWEMLPQEALIAGYDLASDDYTFDLLSDFEGTSIIIRIRDTETREKLAVIKTTTSNTRVEAELYAYRLSVFLGFPGLVPAVHYLPFDEVMTEQVVRLLRGISYRDEGKEARRQRVIRQLQAAARSEETYFWGAMKPWLSAFMFHATLGKRESLASSAVMRYLKANGPQPDDEVVTLQQHTRLYNPRGTHRGTIELWQLAEDLSNMMLMDSLTGQNDRFPGGNLHYMAVSGEEHEVGTARGNPVYDMGEVRLLALDNGAGLSGSHGGGFLDLQGSVVRGTRVERFEEESVRRLRALGRRLLGAGCETAPFEEEVAAIWLYLGLNDDREQRLARGYLEQTLGYIEELHQRHGNNVFLQPRLGGNDTDEPDDETAGLLLDSDDEEEEESPEPAQVATTPAEGSDEPL